ncbi:hypothetical protein CR513_01938, partial [Mucuna pruriens]
MVPLKLVQPPYPKSYDPNTKCDYPGRVIGHPTKKCWGFKHKVQDLIDGGWRSFEEHGPNVNNNPLPAHEGLSINVISHEHYGGESVEARGEDKSRKREVEEDEIIFDSANLVEEGQAKDISAHGEASQTRPAPLSNSPKRNIVAQMKLIQLRHVPSQQCLVQLPRHSRRNFYPLSFTFCLLALAPIVTVVDGASMAALSIKEV